MERKIGGQTLELDFLMECLQSINEPRTLAALAGKKLDNPSLLRVRGAYGLTTAAMPSSQGG